MGIGWRWQPARSVCGELSGGLLRRLNSSLADLLRDVVHNHQFEQSDGLVRARSRKTPPLLVSAVRFEGVVERLLYLGLILHADRRFIFVGAATPAVYSIAGFVGM